LFIVEYHNYREAKVSKSWLVIGEPRAGKTTLSSRLALKTGVSHLHIDSLVDSFERVFPENGISHDGESHQHLARALAPFLSCWLERLCYHGISFVADSYHVILEDAVALRERLGIDLVYIGYPDINAAHKLALMRANGSSSDWTKNQPDDYLLDFLSRCRARSAAMVEMCARQGVKYVNTSSDFDSVINSAVVELAALHGK
jgi:LPS sulfotransferase NodH